MKEREAVKWGADWEGYTEAKAGFILDTLERAQRWAVQSCWTP